MARRCPGARPLGRAALAEWRFNITKRGTASIVRQPGGIVHGVVWRVTPAHVRTLDLYEGVPAGNYVHQPVEVSTPDGDPLRALTYVATRHLSGRARVVYMTTAVLPGARNFELPATISPISKPGFPATRSAKSAGSMSERKVYRR